MDGDPFVTAAERWPDTRGLGDEADARPYPTTPQSRSPAAGWACSLRWNRARPFVQAGTPAVIICAFILSRPPVSTLAVLPGVVSSLFCGSVFWCASAGSSPFVQRRTPSL